jgi:hypothetical protein
LQGGHDEQNPHSASQIASKIASQIASKIASDLAASGQRATDECATVYPAADFASSRCC